MTKNKQSEKFLDEALIYQLRNDEGFASWLLDQTKFRGRSASLEFCEHSRHEDPLGETDVLVIYQDNSGLGRLALHIENKMIGGRFMPNQLERYHKRAKLWQSTERYGTYADYEVILLLPQMVADRNPTALIHGRLLLHEVVGQKIPCFLTSVFT